MEDDEKEQGCRITRLHDDVERAWMMMKEQEWAASKRKEKSMVHTSQEYWKFALGLDEKAEQMISWAKQEAQKHINSRLTGSFAETSLFA